MSEVELLRDARRAAHQSMFPYARTLLHVRGVPIRVDVSWILIAGLVVWVYHSRLAVAFVDRGLGVVLAASLVAALLFFVSLLAHELGHAWTSLDRGLRVEGITLFLLGGVTESSTEAQTAKDEAVIVGIGPYISLALAAVFGVVASYLEPAGFALAAAVSGYLGWTNLGLALFNVVPAYPLDGGRLVHSMLWGVTGNRHLATRWSARVGQVFAALLAAAGLFLLVVARGFGGLWWLLIAFFLWQGAAVSHRRARVQERLAGRLVRDALTPAPPPLDPDLPLDEALAQVQTRPSLLWPVGDPLVGALSIRRIDAVPGDRWATTPVRDVMLPVGQVRIEADASLDGVLDRLEDVPDHGLVVVDAAGRPIGLVTVRSLGGENP